MRNLLIFMLLVAVFVLGKRSCHYVGIHTGVEGTGPSRTEVRSIQGFHAVDLGISGDMELGVGDFKVEVQAQDNILPLIKTSVEDGKLRIYCDENVSYSDPVKIRVTAPAFDEIELSGSGNINLASPLQAENLTTLISGSGDIFLSQVTATRLKADVSGSGNIEVSGKASNADMVVRGSGDIKAKGLETGELHADISGSGNVYAQVLQVLRADISGSGDVIYSGDPRVESHVSGSGDVVKQ